METREAPPAHFLTKIESFSSFGTCGIDKFESNEFTAGEYKWRLIIYCNENDSDYVSVNLAMADTSCLSANEEVNVVFSIFLLNQISGNYLSSTGRTRRFVGIKSEWGFAKFISRDFLLDSSNGYLVNDNCVFGAEVFVLTREAIVECVSLTSVRNWTISSFSKIRYIWHSKEFIAQGQKWRVVVYPRGDTNVVNRGVSIYLCYLGSERVLLCNYTIWIENQVSDNHKKRNSTDRVFTKTNCDWGWASFIEVATINDPKKGFIVDDSCRLHVEISCAKVV
ncbi:PREDICTED: probable inactive serine/threonine-protein kinase fnkC [Erythranthe guttata]|uniref:probable inactive serine/threonine-protein kinase fnkC n=1 Tax=Erythranthe guttata TaxID=4155 RepID=UPI00064D9605|nr:PREDICTED: probable inactive serine/threonine-protein kinase fnkC [Erythranthe guttata]|eukprot:XP_012845590.1 PREDICTED: probable inactive serine/threonine-protein kinase fnkC [Erythranthe guttata]